MHSLPTQSRVVPVGGHERTVVGVRDLVTVPRLDPRSRVHLDPLSEWMWGLTGSVRHG